MSTEILTDELKKKLKEQLKNNPTEAIKIIQQNPKLIEALLAAEDEKSRLENEKHGLDGERVKYMNISSQLNQQLVTTAQDLKTTQGFLLGAGLLVLLMLMDRD
jgi:hypothetical protein